jgi:hypothetical protein
MKLTITFISLLMACTAPVLAVGEEVVVQSAKAAPSHKSPPYRAFDSCAQAFVEQLFPGQEVNLRSQLKQNRLERKEVVWRDLTFTMKALLKSDGSKLANGSCTVSSHDAQVVRMEISTVPAATLAGLTPKDVQLAMVRR